MQFDNFYPSLSGIHTIHPYPHKFVPQIAAKLIKTYSLAGEVVLDPCCGSGTIVAVACSMDRRAVGMDFHPLACLISRVKTMAAPEHARQRTGWMLDKVAARLKRRTELFDFTHNHPGIPDVSGLNRWYPRHILKELAVLHEVILEVGNVPLSDIYTVAFSSMLREVSNASSLYRLTFQKRKSFPKMYVPYLFRQKMNHLIRSLRGGRAQVRQHDGRIPFPVDTVDIIVTSVPSLSLDFVRTFKIHYWWLQCGAKKYLRELDRKRIGTKKLRVQSESVLSQYVNDVRMLVMNCANALKPGGRCCLHLSDFVVGGKTVRIVDLVADMAHTAGYVVEERIKRIIPKRAFLFARHDRTEEIIILRK